MDLRLKSVSSNSTGILIFKFLILLFEFSNSKTAIFSPAIFVNGEIKNIDLIVVYVFW